MKIALRKRSIELITSSYISGNNKVVSILTGTKKGCIIIFILNNVREDGKLTYLDVIDDNAVFFNSHQDMKKASTH